MDLIENNLKIEERISPSGGSRLGKKWFGFTLMENTEATELIGRL